MQKCPPEFKQSCRSHPWYFRVFFFSPVAMSIFDLETSLRRKLKPVGKYLYFNEAIGSRAFLRNDQGTYILIY